MSASPFQAQYLPPLPASPLAAAYLAPAPSPATAAGVAITQTSGSTSVAEGGASDTYTVTLATRPTKNVVISITPGSQLQVSPKKLTFNATNWSSPQTVTVTAVNDTKIEGPHSASISHKVSSSDSKYKGVKAPSVQVSIADNDCPDLASDVLDISPKVPAEIAAVPPPAQSPQATSGIPAGAAWYDTSEYMLGNVWVTVVLLESNGSIDPSTENWTTREIGQVKSEIIEGLEWWEETLARQHPAATDTLEFHVDFTYANSPVSTGYEPILGRSSDAGQWIDSFLNRVGYNTQENVYVDLSLWNHAQRVAHGTDWSYTIFVADSSADADGEFQDGHSAYVPYLGSPYMVMTYDNGGWGIGQMGMVTAHETGHIFYAMDEYAASGQTYTDRSGYYNTQNSNAALGHPNPAARDNSLMAESESLVQAYKDHTSSPSSLEMVGWKDSDRDGLFDVLDVPLTLTGTGSYDSRTGCFNFSGNSSVGTLPNQNPQKPSSERRAISLNRVDVLPYRLDGGSWTDGSTYGGASMAVSQSVRVGTGQHTIEFRTVCRRNGVTSNVWSTTFGTPPAMTISDVVVTEGNFGTSGATFLVSLAYPVSTPITVRYATADGSAVAPGDYDAVSGTLTFNPGESRKEITVAVRGDTKTEPDEWFVVNLSEPTGATIADGQGVAAIAEDDTRVGRLLSGEVMFPGQRILSPNGRYSLRLQSDGNLVLYNDKGGVEWQSKTYGKTVTRAVMKTDGNFVLLNGNKTVWSTKTSGHTGKGVYAEVRDRGEFALYRANGERIWHD